MTETITKKPNIWGSTKSQDYRESFNGVVEVKAKAHGNELQLKPQFAGIEEFVFRAELEILLNEFKQKYVVHAIDYNGGEKARWVGEFVKQDRDYILGELQKRLASINIHPDKDQLTLYLKNVSKVIKAKLARGEEIDALPFTGKAYGKRGRKPKRGMGRKKPVVSPYDNQPYESVAEAARAAQKVNPKITYNAMNVWFWRQEQKENAL